MPAAFVRVQLPAGRRCRRALFQDDRCFLRHSDAGSISPGGGCEGRSTHAARDSSASSPTPIVVLVWLRRSAGRRSWRECDTQPAPAFGRHTRHAPVTSIVWLVSGDVHGARLAVGGRAPRVAFDRASSRASAAPGRATTRSRPRSVRSRRCSSGHELAGGRAGRSRPARRLEHVGFAAPRCIHRPW